jgi:hypothetical protein
LESYLTGYMITFIRLFTCTLVEVQMVQSFVVMVMVMVMVMMHTSLSRLGVYLYFRNVQALSDPARP